MKLQHPLTRLIYNHNTDGTVLVEGKDGRTGLFDCYGNWISGERRSADPMLCRFVSVGYMPPWNRQTATQAAHEEKQA